MTPILISDQSAISAVLGELLSELTTLSTLQYDADPTLARGIAGQALLLGAAAVVLPDKRLERAARDAVEFALEQVGVRRLSPSLHHGYLGIGWVADYLSRYGRTTERIDLAELDDASIAAIDASGDTSPIDVIAGLVGFGVYYLARLPDSAGEAGLAAVLRCLAARAEPKSGGIAWFRPADNISGVLAEEHPNGWYDLGMAHGQAGVIAFLSMAARQAPHFPGVQQLLTPAVSWLLAQRLLPSVEGHFPRLVATTAAAEPYDRLAWCYGDVGIAAALLSAATTAREPQWGAAAHAILADSIRREGRLGDERLLDPTLCHGTTGLSRVYRYCHALSGAQAYEAAAQRWLLRTLQTRRQGDRAVAGFAYPSRAHAGADLELHPWTGLLQGVAGVGLTLLSSLYPTVANWDHPLLLGSS